MRGTLPILLLLTMLLGACSPGKRDYSRWDNLPASGWVYGDTVSLLPADTSLHDNDSLVTGALRVALRHSSDYPYSNLWLEVTYHSDRRRMMRDTLDITLADVFGRWLGSGFGASYQQSVLVSPSAVVDITRPVSVRHIMRVDTLRGIDQIGVSISSESTNHTIRE